MSIKRLIEELIKVVDIYEVLFCILKIYNLFEYYIDFVVYDFLC